ncbi:WD40 repeat-like protein [Gymnopus androsaceus JB14]|uniref:WD40 repeat-like protein n=1 Tax=Gymnopus androsaceus JB14 TaxID=1447944 RepID=A0A6A4HSG7_9AGAR|nr:WD40 repeat-like protein [Gymnopus androsaceus JB14]
MPMFTQAHHLNIHGGNFSNNTYNTYHGGSHAQDVLNKLNPANASFKSGHHSPCLEGTRTGILEMLMEWARNPHSQPIFWLSGIAGSGKSTIAQSFCESLEKNNLLGGSFFCSRESEECREVRRIVPTLTYFLAQQFKSYYDQIVIALERDMTLASQSIKRQLEYLLLHPLGNINISQEHWYFVLVIDALDECEDVDATQNVISILRAMPPAFYLHIHIFISCRPEYYIQQEFERTSNKYLFKLHDMQTEIVQKDIQLYLHRSLHDQPISANDIVLLSEQAGKFFIYAFTQVQYLKKSPGPSALRLRLNNLLQNKFIAKSIDGLYDLLLTQAISGLEANEKEDGRFFINLIVSLSDPLSQHALSELWKPCDVDRFRSVLNIPEHEEIPIHIFHASFSDYVLDQRRCHVDFYCDPDEIHQILTLACIKYMNKNLKYNTCNMQIDNDVTCFSQAQISPSLQYSCKHWIFHLTKCTGLSKEIFMELEKFSKQCLFFWMEILCILQSIENAIPGLKAISSWLKEYTNKECEFFDSVVYESRRFLQLIVSLIQMYPLQLYPALAWLPNLSVLREIQNIEQTIPKVLYGLQDTWDSCEMMIRVSYRIGFVALSPDGNKVVSGTYGGEIVYIWNVATGQQIQKLIGHSQFVSSAAFSPDGKQVVTGSGDKTAIIWNVATGQQIQILKGHSGQVISVAFSPDGKQVASGSADETAMVWNVATGQRIKKLKGRSSWVNSVAFSPDGKQVVSGSHNKTAHIWNATSGQLIHTLKGHSDSVSSVAFSPDGTKVVSRSRTLYIWDVTTGKLVQKLGKYPWEVQSVAFSPKGIKVVYGTFNRIVYICNVTASKRQIQTLEGHSDHVNSVAFSLDGKQVVSGSHDQTIRVWNVVTGNQIPESQSHSSYVYSAIFSPDGKKLVTYSSDTTLLIWNVATGQHIQKLAGHSSHVESVSFSPDGKQVVSGSCDRQCIIWNVATGQKIRKLKGHSSSVYSAAFSPDGKQVVSGSRDRTVRIWHSTTGKLIHKLQHLYYVRSVAFSPDGTQVVSSSGDYICIWKAATGQKLEEHNHHADIASVKFSQDGKQVLYYSGKKVHMYNIGSSPGTQIPTFQYPAHIIYPTNFFLGNQDMYIYNKTSHFLEPLSRYPGSSGLWIAPQYQNITFISQHESTICFGGKSGAFLIIQMPLQQSARNPIHYG